MTHDAGDSTTGPVGWSEYMPETCSLPYIYAHLHNMQYFTDTLQRHFNGKRILEIGTGTGIIAVYLSQLGFDVTGLDYDYEIVRRNRRMAAQHGSGAAFLQGDMFALPFADQSFDACYHQGLMEHFDEADIVRSLKHQAEVCRRVIFMVPTDKWRGGVRGDERMWSGTYWRNLLSDFHILHTFGSAYSAPPARVLQLANRKFLKDRPGALFRKLALQQAGEIGFVLEKRH